MLIINFNIGNYDIVEDLIFIGPIINQQFIFIWKNLIFWIIIPSCFHTLADLSHPPSPFSLPSCPPFHPAGSRLASSAVHLLALRIFPPNVSYDMNIWVVQCSMDLLSALTLLAILTCLRESSVARRRHSCVRICRVFTRSSKKILIAASVSFCIWNVVPASADNTCNTGTNTPKLFNFCCYCILLCAFSKTDITCLIVLAYFSNNFCPFQLSTLMYVLQVPSLPVDSLQGIRRSLPCNHQSVSSLKTAHPQLKSFCSPATEIQFKAGYCSLYSQVNMQLSISKQECALWYRAHL